jgi:pyruvate kinase
VPAEAQPRRAKIVATLGPATDGLECELVAAGVDVARLNFSHGAPEEHARRCAAIRAAAAELGRCVAVMQDLSGPKIRIGRLEGGGPIELVPGQALAITTRDVAGNAERIGCTYPELPRDVAPGDHVLLDDGRIRLVVVGVAGAEVQTRVEEGGSLAEHKGVNLPGVAVSAPALTEKDRQDLRFGLRELDVDYVALSFVRTAEEVAAGRSLVRSLGCDTPLVVKLEKPEAVERLEALLGVADGVMVARGDLGVELAPEQVPMLQKRIIHHANQRGIPVITATQMLESMVSEETPTRAEATDVANAVWDGSDSVMLSAETAIGRHPVLAVRMMQRIICAAEAAALPTGPGADGGDRGPRGPAAAVTRAARVLAEGLGASAIVGVTRTGRTAELLSWGRARVPIHAFSPDERVCRRLALWWGVTAVHHPLAESLEGNIEAMEAHLLRRGLAGPGDRVVITGSHPFRAGVHTNFVKYQVVGKPAG